MCKENKYQSRQTGRTITILGDEHEFRYFAFDDSPSIIVQILLSKWDEFFIKITNGKEK